VARETALLYHCYPTTTLEILDENVFPDASRLHP
jgi:hypothetical protein